MRYNPRKHLLLVALACAAFACAAEPKEELFGRPPTETELVGRGAKTIPSGKPKRAAKQEPEPLVSFETWPLHEPNTSFELKWDAPASEVDVYKQPSLNAEIVGQAKYSQGQRIGWRRSVVAVFRPAVFRAKMPAIREGSVYLGDEYDTGGSNAHVQFAKNEVLLMYHYAGGGFCYIAKPGPKSEVFKTTCPGPDEFSGRYPNAPQNVQMQPEDRLWWVYVETATVYGWIILDDRVLADTVPL
jgi:hypothetical protein